MEKIMKDYLSSIKACLESLPLDKLSCAVSLMLKAIAAGKQIIIFGNGGSASTAAHFVCDLAKGVFTGGGPRIKALSLNDCIPLMTAWSNDEGYDRVFVEPLANYLEEGDLVIGISASGNSPNVLRAIEYANRHGAVTVGLVGKGGGELADLAQLSIVVKSDSYEEVEDIHVVITHMLKLALIQKLSE
ncbi:MAG: SIS domain-containing protein [PVC group bacterium]